MGSVSDQTPTPGATGFPDELASLRSRLRQDDELEADAELVAALETAYEELRVADEEVRTQQEQISDLVEDKRLLRLQHERMLAVLPVAVLTTDHEGLIRSVNAAAAGLAGTRVARMLRKPVFTLFAPDDRPDLRRRLSAHLRDGESFRQEATLLRRDAPPVPVEVFGSVLPGTAHEVSWILLSSSALEDLPASDRLALATALVELATLPTTVTDVHQLLHRAASICQEALGEDTALSLDVGDPRNPVAVASSDQAAQELDGDQMVADEGPCLDAYDQRTTIVATSLERDERWRALARRVSPLVGAVSAPIQTADELVGTMNVYVARTPDRDLVETVELLASTVGALLVDLNTRVELTTTAHQLEEALTSRATIDQAKGIIMAHRRCGPDEAFQHLVGLCSSRNVKLRVLAQEIVDRAAP